jgi:hypothetical protein
MSLPIHPQTKVGALLEAYPGVEEALIAAVPAFARLRNPILRRTVAKVATLEQAAKIGGIPVDDLVSRLRNTAGQSAEQATGGAAVSIQDVATAPAWIREDRVRYEIDADAMLEHGVHPIGKVRECVAELEAGEIVRLTSSFRPEPLIDLFARGGQPVYSIQTTPGRHVTYIGRKTS